MAGEATRQWKRYMTKGELIEFLQPFTDDISIVVGGPWDPLVPVTGAKYGLTKDGEGLVILAVQSSVSATDN